MRAFIDLRPPRRGHRRLGRAGTAAGTLRRFVVALAALAALGACTASAGELPPPSAEGRRGLQGTGTLDGKQVAVGEGLPRLLVGDCDPPDGRDSDVCVISETIDGRLFVLSFENPDVLADGAELPVGGTDCPSPQACDDVTGEAVVTLKTDTDRAVRATGGVVRISRVVPFQNYVGQLTLELPNGRFSGAFDVVPRPD